MPPRSENPAALLTVEAPSGWRLELRRTLDAADDARWLEYWNQHAHATWRQHPAVASALAAEKTEVLYAMVRQDGRFVLAGTFSLDQSAGAEAVCQRGPLCDDVAVLRWALPHLQSYFRTRGASALRVGPYWRFPEAAALQAVFAETGFTLADSIATGGMRPTAIVDLRRTEEELLASYAKSTRYQVTAASKAGITCDVAREPAETAEFFAALDAMELERGMRRTPAREADATAAFLRHHPDVGAIIVAKHQGIFLGGCLVVRGGKSASLPKFVVGPECRRLFPTLRLAAPVFHAAFVWARAQGCIDIDLEGYFPKTAGVTPAFDSSYKSGFRPQEAQTLAQYHAAGTASARLIERLRWLGTWAQRLPKRVQHRLRFAAAKRGSSA